MADGPYYSWSNFALKVNEWGQPQERLVPGDEVTAKKLGISDEEFQGLIDSGAVRMEPYPENMPDGMSPAEWYAFQDRELAEGRLSPEDAQAVRERQLRQATGETGMTSYASVPGSGGGYDLDTLEATSEDGGEATLEPPAPTEPANAPAGTGANKK